MSSECIYDKECADRYGIKTCILIEMLKDTFELRVLDCPVYNRIQVPKKRFYEIIPKMLMNKYTVVVIEQYPHSKEITAVHLPVQSHLTTPPILQ